MSPRFRIWLLASILLSLAGCGSGGGGGDAGGGGNSRPASVDLNASAAEAPYGSTVMLTWTAVNVNSCTATGAWSGSLPNSGSRASEPVTQESVFGISCVTASGSISDSVTVGLAASGAPPTILLSTSSAFVAAGKSTTLQWEASNAQSCIASGAWSGSRPASGTFGTPAITARTVYSLECSGPGGTANSSLVVAPSAIRFGEWKLLDVGGNAPHWGMFPIGDQPVSRAEPYWIAADIEGPVASATVELRDEGGAQISSAALQLLQGEDQSRSTYYAQVVPPAGPFLVIVRAQDENGVNHEHALERVVAPQSVAVDLAMTSAALAAGSTVSFDIGVQNHFDVARTFTVSAQSAALESIQLSATQVIVPARSQAVVTATARIPSSLAQFSEARIRAHAYLASDTNVTNSREFLFYVD